MQLDIFEHSRDVMLRNDVLHALQRRDHARSQAALAAFADEFPDDPGLPALSCLVTSLEPAPAPPFADAAETLIAVRELIEGIAPAARQSLGSGEAEAWLAPLWRQLALRAERVAFSREHAEAHSAALLLKAADFKAAAAAVERIESWRRIPEPLSWMVQARWHSQGLDACWALLAELAWLAPPRCDAIARRLADPLLRSLLKGFDAEFEGDSRADDLAWFPVWLLIDKPALASTLSMARTGTQHAPERAMWLLLDLLHLERQGRQRELVAQRRSLRDLHAGLYAAYMRSR